jgi:hypothetical protein
MQLSETMMQMLRGRIGLDAIDTSKDAAILKMEPHEVVRECCAWKLGDPAWATQIAYWMRRAGCTVDDLADK